MSPITHLFTPNVLQAFVQSGQRYFVRNTYRDGFISTGAHRCFLITHYTDEAKAVAHFEVVKHDVGRFFYDWKNGEHQDRLHAASLQPTGFRIYSTLFYPNWKQRVKQPLKEKVNRYLTHQTDWTINRAEPIHTDLYWQYGELYLHISHQQASIKVNMQSLK